MEGGDTGLANVRPLRERRRHHALTMVVLCLAAIAADAQAAVLSGARLSQHGSGVILQFQLSGRPQWHLSHQGRQLLIDLPNTHLELPVRPLFGAERDPVTAVRTVTSGPGSQIQIEVSGACDYVAGRRRNQLLVGIEPSGAGIDFAALFAALHPPETPDASTPDVRQTSSRPARIRLARAPIAIIPPPEQGDRDEVRSAPVLASLSTAGGQPLVVIDPGHGGYDPGTRSQNGVLEKDLALRVAQKLGATLNRQGVRTLLTRDRDYYLTLHDRIALANRAGADLFVSVHLNWSPNPEASGMQVYYLNNTTDRATLRLARMENSGEDAAGGAPSNLNYILSDLRQQYKANESSVLAQDMEQATVSQLRADFGDTIHGLGARRGPFYVLVGARMPAVLVECGFLSNPDEAARLQSAAYQQALADGLANTIVHYLNKEITAGTL